MFYFREIRVSILKKVHVHMEYSYFIYISISIYVC